MMRSVISDHMYRGTSSPTLRAKNAYSQQSPPESPFFTIDGMIESLCVYAIDTRYLYVPLAGEFFLPVYKTWHSDSRFIGGGVKDLVFINNMA